MVAKATATLDQKDHRTDTDCFLGVEKSLKGKRWIKRDADDRQALALAQRYGLPEVVGRVLAGRGVGLHLAQDRILTVGWKRREVGASRCARIGVDAGQAVGVRLA